MLGTYEKQAETFMYTTKTKMSVAYVTHDKYFDDDKQSRDIWRVTLRRNGKSFSFKFGQSIASDGTPPTAYDVLTCLTKYEPGTFENFCDEYGYDNDSRKAEKVYKAVVKEYAGVARLFSDVIEELAEVQ